MRILFISMLFVMQSWGQVERPKVSEKPFAMMQKLSVLEGSWLLESEYSPDGGETWQASPPSPVEIKIRQKGMMLAEWPIDPSIPGFHLETFVAYDQYRDVYRLAAIDDVWGIMDIYEGQIEDDVLVLTNLKSGTTFPIGEGRQRFFRLKFELQPQKRMLIIDKSDDGGASWQPAFRISYTAK